MWQCYRAKALDADRPESSLALPLTNGCPGAILLGLIQTFSSFTCRIIVKRAFSSEIVRRDIEA